VLSRHDFESTRQPQTVVLDWCYGFYNHDRRHSAVDMMSPIEYESSAASDREVAFGSPPRFRGTTSLTSRHG
jgi:putative transposase